MGDAWKAFLKALTLSSREIELGNSCEIISNRY